MSKRHTSASGPVPTPRRPASDSSDVKNPAPPPIEPVKYKVVITAQGQILWNGNPVTPDQLRQYLEVTQQMNPIPELHLQPDATARYELVDNVLAITKRAHVQKMGFVGNEYYTQVF